MRRSSNVAASALARAGAITGHVGTAALGCPAERRSAVVLGSISCQNRLACARLDSRGRLSPRGPILRPVLIGHLRNGAWREALKETADIGRFVFGIGGKYDQKKSVLAGKRETRSIENRMIGHGQSV